jgi:hypothetical protein
VVHRLVRLLLIVSLSCPISAVHPQRTTPRPLRYAVEVTPSLIELADHFAASVDSILGDPRSWHRLRPLQRALPAVAADVTIQLAEPSVVDALCQRVGLDTRGHLSCFTGRVVAINARRWQHGAPGFTSIEEYRRYLINHEVGHALGRQHEACPETGALAPVMMQQTKGIESCVANGWPFPEPPIDSSASGGGRHRAPHEGPRVPHSPDGRLMPAQRHSGHLGPQRSGQPFHHPG